MTAVLEARGEHAPFSADAVDDIKQRFARDGYCLIPGVLSDDEVAQFKSDIDAIFDDPTAHETDNIYGFVAVRLFEKSKALLDMLDREPIIGIVESILGPDCHLIAQNAVRNAPGQAIDFFHADDLVIFPAPDGIERHDPRYTMPVFLLTVQIPLTDIPSDEYGPTQFVPTSHYSGRQPNDAKNPSFEGHEPVSILANAGDIYLHNGQCWHRGAPNTSDRTRYLLQIAYGMRWVSQRLFPFVNYQLPAHVLDGASERRRRILGFHPKGAYG